MEEMKKKKHQQTIIKKFRYRLVVDVHLSTKGDNKAYKRVCSIDFGEQNDEECGQRV
jgi:hypothetical protein